MKVIITSFLLCLLCVACGSKTRYSQFKNISSEKWNYTDTTAFILKANNTAPIETATITIRHSEHYKYQNLWLDVIYPNNNKVRTEFTLADIAGNWEGKKSGSLFTYSKALDKSQINIGDTLQIIQAMRDDPLEGISAVGIELN